MTNSVIEISEVGDDYTPLNSLRVLCLWKWISGDDNKPLKYLQVLYEHEQSEMSTSIWNPYGCPVCEHGQLKVKTSLFNSYRFSVCEHGQLEMITSLSNTYRCSVCKHEQLGMVTSFAIDLCAGAPVCEPKQLEMFTARNAGTESYRQSQAANHQSSFSQSERHNYSARKARRVTAIFVAQVEAYGDRARDRWIRNKPFKISRDARPVITRDSGSNQMRQVSFITGP